MDDILESQYTYINQLDPEFKESLRLYTSEKLQYYRAINGYLRGDILYINSYEQKMLDDLETVFNGVPALGFPIVVYRGNTRDIINNKAYISTSGEKATAESFTKNRDCCVFVITVSAGSKVVPLITVSEHPQEEEFLLDKDGHFIVTGSDIVNGIRNIFVTWLPQNSYPITEVPVQKENFNHRIIELTRTSLEDAILNDLLDAISEDDIIEELKFNFNSYHKRDPSEMELEELIKMY